MTRILINVMKGGELSAQVVEFPATGYVRLRQILGPYGPLPISRSGFWAGVKDGKFPKPRKISARVTVWRAEDIHELLDKIEQSAA
ncbi:AlpA family transcriptional regulator [Neorhizobium sp. T25_13]|uniref:helix-turn-helix transcriptional regulator n=1 Tax=Neorhizobium sp. T25_13 TaxID=2093830 RepID=UPI001FE0A53F|nr:AlpA family phage regulatory protein [Neorhizobium sp. T25_13]